MVLTLLAMLVTLVWLAGRYEASQVQSRLERDAAECGRRTSAVAMTRNVQSLQALQCNDPTPRRLGQVLVRPICCATTAS